MSATDVNAASERIDDLKSRGVEWFYGAFVDINGVPKAKGVPIAHLPDALNGSELYTVGALEGMGDLGPHEDECRGYPNLDEATILPWRSDVAVAPADLFLDGMPYSHDSRHVLRQQLHAAAGLGYTLNMGIEPEVYILREKADGGFEPFVVDDAHNVPTRGYDLEMTILADRFLAPMIGYINELGWDVNSFDHEGGDGQYEFDFGYCDAMRMADRMIIFRLMAKHVARELGCFATFMPKPFVTSYASAGHVNMSLWNEGGENVFGAEGGEYTEVARQFTAGLLRHAGSITAVACPTVNSYKRLLPHGFMREITWAPVYAAYGDNNRTLMCRLPMNRHAIELRTADSACNFHLVTAMALAAGLEGIKEQLDPGQPVNEDTYKLIEDPSRRDELVRLPRTLGEAVDAFEEDSLAKEVFGPDFHATYIEYKREEWNVYNTIVTEWEQDRYLRLL